MKLSRNFVSDYIDLEVPTSQMADDMTSIGNEYDSCGKLIPATKLIIGEVVECDMHPDSDHLHLCKVNIGSEVLQIICGAPNVRKDLKVIVALDGAELPDKQIKRSMIRGEESNGMLCSISELGLEQKFLKPEDVDGIHELPSDAPVGGDPLKYLMLDDEVVDFELTSNRGDLLSILGMAYELGALYDKKVKDIDLSYTESSDKVEDEFNLEVETDNCPLFLVKKVKNVVIKDSPEFIKKRLIASGIRPINNVVDISNYVMLETGQPLHFYDADRLGDTIVVRMAGDQEEVKTLDGKVRTLASNDIVIANKTQAVGLAGVMGGFDTEIESDTKNIVIESAIFNPTLIRKTSKKILRSEASNRFEKGIDPKRSYMAIKRSCHLLEKYADAEITSGLLEHNTLDMMEKEISVTLDKINKVLGIELTEDIVLDVFRRLDFKAVYNDGTFVVTVPTRRGDISIKEDLIEEVGRIYGIDRIVGKKMILPVAPGKHNKIIRIIRNKMANLGLNETLSYALTPEADVYKFTTDEFDKVKVLDPMSEDRNTLRYSLIPSLLNIFNYNKARGTRDLMIYEVGKGFYKKDKEYHEEQKLAALMTGVYNDALNKEVVDFYVIKGVLEELLDYLGYRGRYTLNVEDLPSEIHPGVGASIILNGAKVGIIGKIHPSVVKEDIYVLEINLDKLLSYRVKAMQYKELSKYPSIVKDLAFVVKKTQKAEDIMAQIKRAGGKLLTDITIFDVYEGENVAEDERSIAFSLTFKDLSKTLTEEDVMPVFNKIMEDVSKKLNVKVRDK